MYKFGSIIQICFTLMIVTVITFLIVRKSRVSSSKLMLFGIGLVVFTHSLLDGHVKYGLDEVFLVIGFGITIAGFIKKDHLDSGQANKNYEVK